MRSVTRTSGGLGLAFVLCACWILFPASPSQFCAFSQETRAADTPPPTEAQYLELPHFPAAQMDAPDAAIVHARLQEITSEAAFFGYDLKGSGWSYDATSCPVIPDYLVLHYRKPFANGTASLFTALVPRGVGRVYVVPILYRNATPFQSATSSERGIAVFNRVVPGDLAAQSVQPDGKWLALGLCYADIVYGNANILNRSGSEMGLARAPLPLLRLSEATTARSIVFTDRNAPGQYLVWSIDLNDKGRVTAASAVQLTDFVARMRIGAEPKEKRLPPGQEPVVKPLPPGQEPPVKTTPQ